MLDSLSHHNDFLRIKSNQPFLNSICCFIIKYLLDILLKTSLGITVFVYPSNYRAIRYIN